MSASEMKKKGLGVRFLAEFFDLGLFGMAGAVIVALMSLSRPSSLDDGSTTLMLWFLFLSNLGMEVVTGVGIGKRLLRVQILSEDGSNAGARALLMRTVIKNGGILLMAVSLSLEADRGLKEGLSVVGQYWCLAIAVGFLLVLGPRRQSLHDRLTKTAVFERT